jgi:hypothetical protein
MGIQWLITRRRGAYSRQSPSDSAGFSWAVQDTCAHSDCRLLAWFRLVQHKQKPRGMSLRGEVVPGDTCEIWRDEPFGVPRHLPGTGLPRAFFHPDCTVGPGVSPSHAKHAVSLAGCTADRELEPALLTLPRRTSLALRLLYATRATPAQPICSEWVYRCQVKPYTPHRGAGQDEDRTRR